MFRRLFAFLLLIWALGFAWFALLLPQPADGTVTDAVVVLTGGGGRIERGIEVVENGWARQLLVSGVDPEVTEGEFAAQFGLGQDLLVCCVTLGYDAVDTRSNATETALWVREHGYGSLRLVTSDWHMRRAAADLSRALASDVPADKVTVVRDAVPGEPTLFMLFLEYHKLLAGYFAAWVL